MTTIQDKAVRLREHLQPKLCTNFTIGIGEKGQYNNEDFLCVYTETRVASYLVPLEFEGTKVRVRTIGKIVPAGDA